MPTLEIARQDVTHVVGGYSVDGQPMDKQVSFPSRASSLDAASVLAQIIYTFLDASHPGMSNDPHVRTSIVFKLLAYLSRTGRVTSSAIRNAVQDVAHIATMLAEQPKLITEPVNFAKVLERHHTFMAAYRRALEKPIDKLPVLEPSTAPRRALIWESPEKDFHLHELTHPWHLVVESASLGHCIGHLTGNVPLTNLQRLPDLPYWAEIRTGKCRIFSFSYQKRALCTLQVALKPPTLFQVQGKPTDPVKSTKPYFPALVLAIEQLDTVFNGNLRFHMLPTLTARPPLPGEVQSVENKFKAFLEKPRVRPGRYFGLRWN